MHASGSGGYSQAIAHAAQQRLALDCLPFDELRVPPGHQLEALSSDRKGQHSIRLNKQYRVCLT